LAAQADSREFSTLGGKIFAPFSNLALIWAGKVYTHTGEDPLNRVCKEPLGRVSQRGNIFSPPIVWAPFFFKGGRPFFKFGRTLGFFEQIKLWGNWGR